MRSSRIRSTSIAEFEIGNCTRLTLGRIMSMWLWLRLKRNRKRWCRSLKLGQLAILGMRIRIENGSGRREPARGGLTGKLTWRVQSNTRLRRKISKASSSANNTSPTRKRVVLVRHEWRFRFGFVSWLGDCAVEPLACASGLYFVFVLLLTAAFLLRGDD